MAVSNDIRQAVKAELAFDPLVDAADITVKKLNGNVALNGTVPSYPQYQAAAAATRRVQGVTSVHNHVMVTLPPGDCRDDAMLTTAANNALALTISVPDTVEATASDGNIWLTGMVSSGVQRAAAESAVAGLAGVRNIRDDIEIRSDAEAADVISLVQDALNRYGLFSDGSNVTVEADDGTVTLAGHVRTWAEHDAAINAAWMGTGVSNVRDDLAITS